MDLITLSYLVKMIIYGWNCHFKQLCHSLLRKPKCIGVEDNLNLHIPSSTFIHQDGRFVDKMIVLYSRAGFSCVNQSCGKYS